MSIQPLIPMPDEAAMSADDLAPPPHQSIGPQQHPIIPTPLPGEPLPHASTSMPMPMAPPTLSSMPPEVFTSLTPPPFVPQPTPRAESTSVVDIGRKRRIIVIAASAALVLAVGVVAVIMLTGKKSAPAQPAPAPAPPPPQQGAVDPGSATPTGSAAPKVEAADATPAAGDCKLDVITLPNGAQIMSGDQVIGTSNASIALPCNVEAKLVLRKDGFFDAQKTVTPTSTSKPLRAVLQSKVFSVKVSSKPTGATVMYKGKSLGVTPLSTQLPAYDTATLTFLKDGFASDTQTVTPKSNNLSVLGTLKKK